jgi:hypothetical protein
VATVVLLGFSPWLPLTGLQVPGSEFREHHARWMRNVTSMGCKAAAEKDKDRKPHFRVHIHGFVSPFDSLKNRRFSVAIR